MAKADQAFYDRADAHINLSNQQLKSANRGEVAASMLFGCSRYSTWVTACGVANAEEMKANKDDTIEYFLDQYKKMLEENFADYIRNFDSYMGKK